MDTGSKTLAQLSEENKEKKYVTLDTGSKISGYTKDYLERLCRLNKVEYRLWSNGSLVIELESLLRETQAILLSYEGITFVERSELTDPVPQVVGNILSSTLSDVAAPVVVQTIQSFRDTPAFKSGIAQSVPTFGDTIIDRNAPVSFVGRAVVSDALHPEEKSEKKTPVAKAAPAVIATPVQVVAPIAKSEGEVVSVPINKFNMSAIRNEDKSQEVVAPTPELSQVKSVSEKVREHIPIVAINSADDWDAQLLGNHQEKIAATKMNVPTETHATPVHVPIENVTSREEQGFIPPPGQKVIIFSENDSNKEVLLTIPTTGEEGKPVQEVQLIEQALPRVPVANPQSPLIATTAHVPLPAVSSVPLLTSAPELNIPPAKKELPIKAEAVLPMVTPEHHLTPYETHPLMRSTGFNIVFAALLLATSFTALGGRALEGVSGRLNTADYVAGVGATDSEPPSSVSLATPSDGRDALKKGERAMLPFSNEIIATSGSKENTVIIRPVFKDGPGKPYLYILVPEGESSTTPTE